uniref:hypothetical protein n=1 Tax=Xanthomonas oryzae TaxID=347 RepID=UPI003DA00CFA
MRRFPQCRQPTAGGCSARGRIDQYFRYGDPAPTNDQPFAVRTELATHHGTGQPAAARRHRRRDIATADLPPANLVFWSTSPLDGPPDKLPLLHPRSNCWCVSCANRIASPW